MMAAWSAGRRPRRGADRTLEASSVRSALDWPGLFLRRQIRGLPRRSATCSIGSERRPRAKDSAIPAPAAAGSAAPPSTSSPGPSTSSSTALVATRGAESAPACCPLLTRAQPQRDPKQVADLVQSETRSQAEGDGTVARRRKTPSVTLATVRVLSEIPTQTLSRDMDPTPKRLMPAGYPVAMQLGTGHVQIIGPKCFSPIGCTPAGSSTRWRADATASCSRPGRSCATTTTARVCRAFPRTT